MTKTYSQFLKKFSSYNDRIKVGIVKSGFFLKVFLLVHLFMAKLIFMTVAFPYLLFVRTPPVRAGHLQTAAANPQRLQQAFIFSFFVLLLLIFSFQILSDSLLKKNMPLHPSASIPLQFSGLRNYGENINFGIQNVSVSPYDQTLTFQGTGPSFAHVALFVDQGESFIATAKINAEGVWKFIQTPDKGSVSPGKHSVFAVFYGDDNTILGQPSQMKVFDVPSAPFSPVFRYFGLSSLLIALVGLGVLGVSVVKLRKTVTA